MKKKTVTIVSVTYGISLALLAGFVIGQTFIFPSVSGSISSGDTSGIFDFDDDSSSSSGGSSPSSSGTSSDSGSGSSEDSGTGSSESSSESSDTSSSSSEVVEKKTTVSYEECTYTVSRKTVPYMLVTVNLKKISDFRTRVAVNSSSKYGSNITEPFSDMISEAESETGDEVLFAVDGDYPFWSGRDGYVVRNGLTYRSTKRSDSSNKDLAIFKDGTFLAYDEKNIDFDTLADMNDGCYQNWSFGPALLVDSEIAVTTSQDVSQTMSANQRVGMGYKDDGTLYFLCSNTNDGKRNNNSVGLSLYNMASIFKDLGCSLAYNFDGGGSANMYVKGYGSDGYYMEQSRELGDIVYVVNS